MENAFFVRCPHSAFSVLAIIRIRSYVLCFGIDDRTFLFNLNSTETFVFVLLLHATGSIFNILSLTIDYYGTLNF